MSINARLLSYSLFFSFLLLGNHDLFLLLSSHILWLVPHWWNIKNPKKELPVQCLRLFSLTAVSNIKYSETKATSAFPSNDKWNCCSNVNLEPTLEGFNILYCMKLWRLNDGPWGSYYLLWLWVCIRAHNFWEYWAEFFFIWLDKSCGLQSPLHWNSQHNFYEDKRCDNFQAGASMRKGCLKMHPTEKYCNAKESLHWKKIFLMKSFIKGRRNKGKMPEDPIP